ncbi:MAG: transposase [Candidatus Wallbacteria bacterium]|nr:transposase [Candidatus Wallbacteria bacterium]
MAYNFRPFNRDQLYLLPPSMRDWIREDDLVWLVLDAVGELDLTEFLLKYRSDGRGASAFDPSMMVALLLYAYAMGVRSSRKIERLCERDAAFRIVSGDQRPDHTTIARYRANNEKELSKLFTQVLFLCRKAGLRKVGKVALDGTKLKANAALDANRKYKKLLEEEQRLLKEEAERMLKEAAEEDTREDALYGQEKRGDELPEPLRKPESRLARLREAKRQLEEEAAEVIPIASDYHQLFPMLKAAGENLQEAGYKEKIKVALADAGYCVEEELAHIPEGMPELIVALSNDKTARQSLRDKPHPRGRIPKNLTARQRMERRLATKRGQTLYKRRKCIVEPVFGQIKSERGTRQFQRRGLRACQSEWNILCTAHNLMKLWRAGRRRGQPLNKVVGTQ